MDLKDFITNTTNATKTKIISLVNYQLTNEEKKQRLDDYINDYLAQAILILPIAMLSFVIFKTFVFKDKKNI